MSSTNSHWHISNLIQNTPEKVQTYQQWCTSMQTSKTTKWYVCNAQLFEPVGVFRLRFKIASVLVRLCQNMTILKYLKSIKLLLKLCCNSISTEFRGCNQICIFQSPLSLTFLNLARTCWNTNPSPFGRQPLIFLTVTEFPEGSLKQKWWNRLECV